MIIKYYIFAGLFYRLFFDLENIAMDCMYYIIILNFLAFAQEKSWAIFNKINREVNIYGIGQAGVYGESTSGLGYIETIPLISTGCGTKTTTTGVYGIACLTSKKVQFFSIF